MKESFLVILLLLTGVAGCFVLGFLGARMETRGLISLSLRPGGGHADPVAGVAPEEEVQARLEALAARLTETREAIEIAEANVSNLRSGIVTPPAPTANAVLVEAMMRDAQVMTGALRDYAALDVFAGSTESDIARPAEFHPGQQSAIQLDLLIKMAVASNPEAAALVFDHLAAGDAVMARAAFEALTRGGLNAAGATEPRWISPGNVLQWLRGLPPAGPLQARKAGAILGLLETQPWGTDTLGALIALATESPVPVREALWRWLAARVDAGAAQGGAIREAMRELAESGLHDRDGGIGALSAMWLQQFHGDDFWNDVRQTLRANHNEELLRTYAAGFAAWSDVTQWPTRRRLEWVEAMRLQLEQPFAADIKRNVLVLLWNEDARRTMEIVAKLAETERDDALRAQCHDILERWQDRTLDTEELLKIMTDTSAR